MQGGRVRLRSGRDDYRVWFDPLSGELLYPDGDRTVLRPKACAVLQAMLERPGEICSKDALLAAAWPGECVVEAALRNAVTELRKALRDGAESPRIATVPRRGYRVLLQVEPEPEPDDPAPASEPEPAPPIPPRAAPAGARARWLGIAALLSVVVAAAIALFARGHGADARSDGLSAGGGPGGGCGLRMGRSFGADRGQLTIVDDAAFSPGVGDLTISLWLRARDEHGVLLDNRDMTPAIRGYAVMLYHGRPLFQLATPEAGWRNFVETYQRVVPGKWYQLVVTVERDQELGGKMFLDGRLVNAFMPGRFAGSLDSQAPLFVGRDNDGQQRFDGEIAGLRFFKRALSEADVAQLYAQEAIAVCHGEQISEAVAEH